MRHIVLNYVDLNEECSNNFLQTLNGNFYPSSPEKKNDFNYGLMASLINTLSAQFKDQKCLANFQILSQSMLDLNSDCDKCKSKFMRATFMIQKLLLMISLNDNSSQVQMKIDHFIDELSQIRIQCESCIKTSYFSDFSLPIDCARRKSSSEAFEKNKPTDVSKQSDKMANSNAAFDSTEEADFLTNKVESKVSLLGLNVKREKAHFKVAAGYDSTDPRSYFVLNPNYNSEDNEISCSSRQTSNKVETPLKVRVKSENSKFATKNFFEKIFKDKYLKYRPKKCWSSVESYVTPESRIPTSYLPKAGCSSDSAYNAAAYTNEELDLSPKFQNFKHSRVVEGCRSRTSSAKENIDYCSRSSTQSESEKKKIHQEIMNVKLVKEDDCGFGFLLGFMSPSSPIPVILSIKPKSVAKRAGVLSVYDRVLAIDGRSIVGMSIYDLEEVKENLSSALRVILTVEFDVSVAQTKFGVFDVRLNRSMIPGFIFEDASMGNATPLRLKGIIRGSAAHRSGEVFVGDELLFLKCQREEEFNPINSDYNRQEFIIVTIRRVIPQVKRENQWLAEDHSGNSFDPISGVVREGRSFRIIDTCVRQLDGNTVVIDVLVRLFRDPKNWDFGFLVGEKPSTGQAYITDVRIGGPAYESGVVKKFDRIIKVDGVTVDKEESFSILSLLTQANEKVDLLLRRIHPGETSRFSRK